MNAAKIVITPDLLREVLRLPDGVVLSDASMSADGRYISFVAEHAALPVVRDGAMPMAHPVYRRNFDKSEPSVEFVDWGLK